MLHIIDVLRGAKNQKITQYEHDKLSTYGIGKDRSVDDWRMLGRSLLHQGLLEQTHDGYSVLKLNAHSWEVMRRQRKVEIAVSTTQKLTLVENNPKTIEAEELLYRLRSLRKQLADEQSVPPYVIFDDSTLRVMVQVKPKTMLELGKLSGINSHKLAQYGEKFLSEILRYHQEKISQNQSPEFTPSLSLVSGTELQTLQLHQQGLSVAEIAKQRKLSPSTIVSHLARLIEKNQPVNLNQLVPLEHHQKIWQVLEVLGDIPLTPLKEQLGAAYTFDEIRLVKEKWKQEKRK
jgi:ATP-dependent DNA helicase RecQ